MLMPLKSPLAHAAAVSCLCPFLLRGGASSDLVWGGSMPSPPAWARWSKPMMATLGASGKGCPLPGTEAQRGSVQPLSPLLLTWFYCEKLS